MAEEETEDILKDKVVGVFQAISIDEDCIHGMKRLGKGNPPEYHAPVEVTLAPTVEMKKAV